MQDEPPPLARADLVLAHGTLRGAALDVRVRAAAAAGFAGVGLSARGYLAARADGWSDAAVRVLLADHGVALVETEGPFGFSPGGVVPAGPLAGRRYGDPDVEATVFAMADAFGVRHVNVGGRFDAPAEPGDAGTFAALCDRAAAHGLLVALEPLPGSSVADLSTALDLLERADRPNAGLCVDSWHVYRGHDAERQLQGLPGERVLVVQVDDGPASPVLPNYLADTLHGRCLPGHGEFPLTRFLTQLDAAGVRAPVSVEVLSDELDRLPADERARRAERATRTVLATLEQPVSG